MEDLCRICRQSDVDEMISVSCRVASQQKTIGEMLDAVAGVWESRSTHGLMPDHLCDQCVARLDRIYTMWKLCRMLSSGDGQQDCNRCRICAQTENSGLISISFVCTAWNIQIVDMVQHLTGVRFREGVGLQPQVCSDCLKDLNLGYEFKKQAIESIQSYREAELKPWEEMRLKENGRDLVVELSTEGRLDWGKKGTVYCLVCDSETPIHLLDETCDGCSLPFSNREGMLNEIKLHKVQKSAVEKPDLEMEVDDYDYDDPMAFDPSAEVENANKLELTEAEKMDVDPLHNSSQTSKKVKKLTFKVIKDYGNLQSIITDVPMCCTCGLLFPSVEKVIFHCRSMHPQMSSGTGPYHCPLCNVDLKGAFCFKSHYGRVQRDSYMFCKPCKRILFCSETIDRHKKKHGAPKLSVAEKNELKKTRFGIEKKVIHACCVPKCNWTGPANRITWHLKQFHRSLAEVKPPNTLTCQFCRKTFSTNMELTKHRGQKKVVFKCLFDGCTFLCKSMGQIVAHYAIHRNTSESIKSSVAPELPPTASEPPTVSLQITKVLTKLTKVKPKPQTIQSKSTKVKPEPQRVRYDENAPKATHVPKARAMKKIATEYVTEYRCCVKDCTESAKTLGYLQSHYDDAHPELPTVEFPAGVVHLCQYCERSFATPEALKNHCLRKTPLYKCLIEGCSLASKDKAAVLKHCAGKHQNCNRSTSSSSPKPTAKVAPDLEKFNVVGSVTDSIDIVVRKGEWCCKCCNPYPTVEQLRAHRDLVHRVTEKPPPFQCSQCNAGFQEETKLTEHMESVAKRKQNFYCRSCKLIITQAEKLVIHRYYRHYDGQPDDEVGKLYDEEVTGPFRCCGCSSVFYAEQDLFAHRQQDHPDPGGNLLPLQCGHCYKIFESQEEFLQHRDKYSYLVYRCKIGDCYFNTDRRLTMKKHVCTVITHRHVPQPIRKHVFQCCIDGCYFEDTSYWTTTQHVVATHPEVRANNEKLYQGYEITCQACGEGFDSNALRDSHKIRRQDQQPFVCDECPMVLNGKIALGAHKIRYHGTAIKKYVPRTVCTICGKMVTIYRLPEHMDIHKNERKWKCPECPSAFNVKVLLNKHLLIHRQLKPAICRYGCGKQYRQSVDRNRHEKLVHENVKPFVCEICDASFIRDRDLRLHSRKHTGLKLFPCKSCGASFDLLREFEAHQC